MRKSSLYNQLSIIAYGYLLLVEKTVFYIINRKYNTRFTSRVEHLNMTFTMIFRSYSYIIRLVRYLGDEI